LRSATLLTTTLQQSGQYKQARHLGQDTLTRARRVLGIDHPDTVRSAMVLAVTLRELGQYEQARQLGQDTLTRARQVLGDDHPHTVRFADAMPLSPM
ncbi:MAG: tetratricopeptide repeat protein, partial [Pseudonocardiales bacterium]|nr:tetratricopeptide repeat protein [Pseudonocardiales bacterium]